MSEITHFTALKSENEQSYRLKVVKLTVLPLKMSRITHFTILKSENEQRYRLKVVKWPVCRLQHEQTTATMFHGHLSA